MTQKKPILKATNRLDFPFQIFLNNMKFNFLVQNLKMISNFVKIKQIFIYFNEFFYPIVPSNIFIFFAYFMFILYIQYLSKTW